MGRRKQDAPAGHHHLRDRKRPTCYVTAEPYQPALGPGAAFTGRVIVLSTGRGDIRIDWHEAGLLIDELQECRRQVGLAATKAQKRATKQQEAAT
jgi:hypothetical protein